MMRGVTLLLCWLCCVYSLNNGLGLTPPMGWSSWSTFLLDVTETAIRETADALIATGLRDLGFEYINIDAGYCTGRDKYGNLIVDKDKFPSGMKALGDYLHSKGFKMGVYTDIGNGSCGNGAGSYGYYDHDAKQFASWGADYLKVDFCGTINPKLTQWDHWAALRDSLNRTGRPIYYSICPKTEAPNTGTALPYTGQEVYSPPLSWSMDDHRSLSNSWLVEYENNVDYWYSNTYDNCQYAWNPCGIITNVDSMVLMTDPSFSGPGGWNDADLLQVCNFGNLNGGMTMVEYKSSYSLWAIWASPMILTADIRNINQNCLNTIIKNTEVIAINQDPLGSAGVLVYQKGPEDTIHIEEQIFVRKLQDGSFAAVMFNRRMITVDMTIDWEMIGLPFGSNATIRDVWQHEDLGSFQDEFTATTDGHGVTMIKITPV